MIFVEYVGSKIKKPNQVVPLTEEEAEEFVKCALDFDHWASTYLWVQTDRGKSLFNPRDYQKRMLSAFEDNPFSIILAPRQVGKSVTAMAYLLHQLIFFPDIHIGICSYRLSNVKDIMDRLKFGYEHLPFFLQPGVREYNRFTVVFTNNSGINGQVIKESTFRGTTNNILYVDELAFVKPSIAEEFWGGILPSIMGGGEDSNTKILLTSTPNGSTDIFSNLWFNAVQGTNGFFPVEVKYEEAPGRTEKFEQDMLGKMSKARFLQEFKCHFISSKGCLISSMVLESLQHQEPIMISEDLHFFKEDLTGRKIAIAVDVGEGVDRDYHAIQIVDIGTLEQVGEYRNNNLPQTQFTKEFIRILRMVYDMGASEVYYTVENNGVGNGVINLLVNTTDPVVQKAFFVGDPESQKFGLHMNKNSKAEGCMKLKDLVENNKLKINSQRLITELKFFVKTTNGSYKAESGMHDDLCMSMVLAVLLLKYVADFEEDIYDTFNEIEFDPEKESYEVGIFF